jgi:hypothetical protein
VKASFRAARAVRHHRVVDEGDAHARPVRAREGHAPSGGRRWPSPGSRRGRCWRRRS